MEMMAAISALEALKRPCVVDIHTDSQYVRDGITKYINNWKRNGWRTAAKEPVKNQSIYGSGWKPRATGTRCAGTGSRAIRAISSTIAPMNWCARPEMR